MEEISDHVIKLSIDAMDEDVSARPVVECMESEITNVLNDLKKAVEMHDYIVATPTAENPALSEDYIFDEKDQEAILKDLKPFNLVAKIKDVGKGAKRRLQQGLPQEYLYVFKYPCILVRLDADDIETKDEKVMIYIKINNRKIPIEKVIVISFHKNRLSKVH